MSAYQSTERIRFAIAPGSDFLQRFPLPSKYRVCLIFRSLGSAIVVTSVGKTETAGQVPTPGRTESAKVKLQLKIEWPELLLISQAVNGFVVAPFVRFDHVQNFECYEVSKRRFHIGTETVSRVHQLIDFVNRTWRS